MSRATYVLLSSRDSVEEKEIKREKEKDGKSRTEWPGLKEQHEFCSLAVFRANKRRERR